MKKQALLNKKEQLLKELDFIDNEIKEIDSLKNVETYIYDYNKNYLEQYELILKHSNDFKMFTLSVKDDNAILMVINNINTSNYEVELVGLAKELHEILKFKSDYLNLKNYLLELNKERKSKFSIEHSDYHTSTILVEEKSPKYVYKYLINTETKDLTVKTTLNAENVSKTLNLQYDNLSELTINYKLQNDKSYYNKPKLEEDYVLTFKEANLEDLPFYRKTMDKAISEYSYVKKLENRWWYYASRYWKL